jgi:GntR family transcriptional regulator
MSDSPELVLDGAGPIWRQIAGQLRRLMRTGALRPGEELPTVRALAVGLAVNPHAVEQAYHRLERAGLLSRSDGSSPRVAAPANAAREVNLRHLCEVFLRRASERGHSFAAVLETLQACRTEEICHGEVCHGQTH